MPTDGLYGGALHRNKIQRPLLVIKCPPEKLYSFCLDSSYPNKLAYESSDRNEDGEGERIVSFCQYADIHVLEFDLLPVDTLSHLNWIYLTMHHLLLPKQTHSI